jgi:hypothetical protein
MKRSVFLGLIAVLLAGCSQNHYAQWKKLDVVYASQVPIFPGAEVEDAMGGNYYGESLDERVSESMTYWFKIDPQNHDQIVAFYAKALPNAERTVDEDGEVRFEFVPKGAEPGEKVWVGIAKDRLRIGEDTKPGKHKES